MSVAPQSYRLQGYSGFAKSMHWIVALCVLTIIPVGITMNRIADGTLKDNLFNFHKSLGALILMLMTVRLIYRLVKGAPPEPGIPLFYRVAGSVTHWTLYVMLIVMPFVAWIGHSAFGARVPFFGLFELPLIWTKNEQLSEQIFRVHGYMGWVIGALVLMHIGAALFHYVIRRDGVMERMLPGGGASS